MDGYSFLYRKVDWKNWVYVHCKTLAEKEDLMDLYRSEGYEVEG